MPRLDEDGHVIYVRSLTKPVAAGLRVAALVARGPALTRLCRGRVTDDLFVAPALQHTALDVLTAPGWPRHLAGLRRALRLRRDTLTATWPPTCPADSSTSSPAEASTCGCACPREPATPTSPPPTHPPSNTPQPCSGKRCRTDPRKRHQRSASGGPRAIRWSKQLRPAASGMQRSRSVVRRGRNTQCPRRGRRSGRTRQLPRLGRG